MVLHSLTHLAYSYTPLHTIEHSYIPSHTLTHSYTPSQAYTCGHMYIVSSVTPSQAIYILSQVHSLQGQPLPQTLHFKSHIHCPGNEPTSQNLYQGLLGYPTSQTLYLESHIQSL